MSTPFSSRHNGPRVQEHRHMLSAIGVSSLEELIDKTIPAAIRLKSPLSIDPAMSEADYLSMLWEKAKKNKVFRSYIGMGYYPTHTPTVILRNVLENPGWYTAYTPYQAEIAQGRLEALLNFQTMVSDLTGLPDCQCQSARRGNRRRRIHDSLPSQHEPGKGAGGRQ
jgi:glycine dehydrogenase